MTEQEATSSKPSYRKHTNKEKVVKCPYCEKEVASRGLYMHVYNKADDEHGGHENVPQDFNERRENLEEVGKRDVSMVVPTHKKFDRELVMCKWCGDTFQGTHGLGTHLGRVEGDGNHPVDAEVHTSGIRIPVTEDHEPVWTAEQREQVEEELEFDPDADLEELWAEVAEKGDSSELAYQNPPTDVNVTGEIPASAVAELAHDFDRKAAEGENPTWSLAAERIRALIERET